MQQGYCSPRVGVGKTAGGELAVHISFVCQIIGMVVQFSSYGWVLSLQNCCKLCNIAGVPP